MRARPIHTSMRLRWVRRAVARVGAMVLLAIAMPVVIGSPAAAAATCAAPTNLRTVPLTDVPWGQKRLNPQAVWPISRGAGITVAVIDSGVSRAPAVLSGANKFSPAGRDFTVAKGGDPYCDEEDHGTVVAAIIAGRDGTGPFAGIAPDARILSLRAVPKERNPGADLGPAIVNAIRYAIAQNVQVINLSISTPDTTALHDAIDAAFDADIVVVAASGNEDVGQAAGASYPAAYTHVLAVAGVDENGQRVRTSRAGSYIDVAAPGADVIGPDTTGRSYVTWDGTSFAAAYVSGVVALERARRPDLSAQSVIDRITGTADRPPTGRNHDVGYGVVNPYRALTTITGRRRAAEPVPALPPAPLSADPMARQKLVAVWATVVGGVVALALLFGGPVVRAGRRRGWRPGRVSPDR